jgi:hypothetical protein
MRFQSLRLLCSMLALVENIFGRSSWRESPGSPAGASCICPVEKLLFSSMFLLHVGLLV